MAVTWVETEASSLQTTSTPALTIPSDWDEGDFILAFLFTAIRTVSAAPDGWTLVQAETSISDNHHVYRKVMDSGDANESQQWTLNASAFEGYILFHRFTGHDTTTPVDTSDKTTDGSSGTSHVSPDLTTTVNDCLIARLGNNGGITLSASSGDTGTERYQATSPGAVLFTSTKASAGATGTATYTTGANRQLCQFAVAIAPAASSFQAAWSSNANQIAS